ncbi:MAG: SRPBCC family protein [Acidimicrobiia bacterium]|nr:SRPBCC family protein [Acidimicrobiia bacterium]
MGTYVVDLERVTTAAPEMVWRWLADASSWSQWTKLSRTVLEREGSPEPDGVGAVRKFTRSGGSSREEVVAFDPPRHFAYELRSGLPIRNYRSDVRLTPEGTGTRISWHSEFDRKYPGTGALMRRLIRFVLSDISASLVRHAERTA